MARARKSTVTRSRLVAAAGAALVEGEGDFEMTGLAQRAGVSAGLAYHYFGSKAGAVSAVVDDFYDRYDAVVNQDFDPSAPWAERELERLRASVAFLYAEPLAPIVLGRMSRTVQVASAEQTRQDGLIGLARRNIEEGQHSGEIPKAIDSGIAAAAIIGAIRQTASYAFRATKRVEPQALTAQLWALISGALGLRALSSTTEPIPPSRREA